ncbi:MAG: hypothetical protein ACFE8L_12830 [Candidatus Hodarchaeota archaeon]
MGIIYKYRSLIFFLVHIILSLLLPLLFINAISLNTGKDYKDVFMEAYGVAFLLVFVGGGALLFAVFVMAPHQTFKGKGAFLAAVIVYIIGVAILTPVTYFGLLNFGK